MAPIQHPQAHIFFCVRAAEKFFCARRTAEKFCALLFLHSFSRFIPLCFAVRHSRYSVLLAVVVVGHRIGGMAAAIGLAEAAAAALTAQAAGCNPTQTDDLASGRKRKRKQLKPTTPKGPGCDTYYDKITRVWCGMLEEKKQTLKGKAARELNGADLNEKIRLVEEDGARIDWKPVRESSSRLYLAIMC